MFSSEVKKVTSYFTTNNHRRVESKLRSTLFSLSKEIESKHLDKERQRLKESLQRLTRQRIR